MQFVSLYGNVFESLFSDENLSDHWHEHKNQYRKDIRFADCASDQDRMDKYNKIADELSRSKVGISTDMSLPLVGYVAKNGRNVKYDTKFHDFIVYAGNVAITMHKKTHSEYLSTRNRDFFREYKYNLKGK